MGDGGRAAGRGAEGVSACSGPVVIFAARSAKEKRQEVKPKRAAPMESQRRRFQRNQPSRAMVAALRSAAVQYLLTME